MGEQTVADIINFFNYKKTNNNPKPLNKFEVWHKLPILPNDNLPYEIIVRVCQFVNKVPVWSYIFPQANEILELNKETSDLINWAYMENIEKLISDFENPQIS